MAWASIGDFVKHCQRLVRDQDNDCVLLFTGVEGTGKSTLTFQLMRAIDPSFTADDMHFTVNDFLAAIGNAPRGKAHSWDEALINSRKAMHKDTTRLLDTLQVCRGLNQVLGITYPRVDYADKLVLERARYNVHVPQRGRFEIRKLISYKVSSRYGQQTAFKWKTLASYSFKPNKGALWDAYGAKKEAHMRSLTDGAESPVSPREACEELGFDMDALDAVLDRVVAAA